MAFDDLKGRRFFRLVATERGPNTKHGTAAWQCRCDCGQTKLIAARSLVSGKTRSCGCFYRETRGFAGAKGWFQQTHGQAGNPDRREMPSPEYYSWAAMKSRCSNPNATDYHLYGGRGIKVCDRWNESFEAFFADMGNRPSPKHCIDRINNDCGYSPENCRWATQKIQQRNRRDNRLFILDGDVLTLTDLAEKAGISVDTICHRLRGGWPVDELLTPLRAPRVNYSGRIRHLGIRASAK